MLRSSVFDAAATMTATSGGIGWLCSQTSSTAQETASVIHPKGGEDRIKAQKKQKKFGSVEKKLYFCTKNWKLIKNRYVMSAIIYKNEEEKREARERILACKEALEIQLRKKMAVMTW